MVWSVHRKLVCWGTDHVSHAWYDDYLGRWGRLPLCQFLVQLITGCMVSGRDSACWSMILQSSCLVGRWDHEGIPLLCRDPGSLWLRRLTMIWSCSALVSCLTISPSDTCPAWLSSALEYCWNFRFNIVTSWLLILLAFIYLSPSPIFNIFLLLYPSGLRYPHLGLFSYYIAVLGPGIKSVNME